jgi:dolichol kinase
MKNIEELKQRWGQDRSAFSGSGPFDQASLRKIFKSRIQKQKNTSMKYFWSAFTLHIIVYALLSHVAITSWADTPMLLVSLFLVSLYIPFTVVLLNKFKRLAVLKVDENHTAGMPIHEYVAQQHTLLSSFYQFKRKYEMFLVPLGSAIMIWIFFRIYLPGGVNEHWVGAIILFVLTMGACIAAIVAENKKRFKQPLSQLEEILQDLKQ